MSGSSRVTRPITTNTGVTAGWPEPRRLNAAAQFLLQSQTFSHIAGGNTATPYFRPQLPHELEFDTHTIAEDDDEVRLVPFKNASLINLSPKSTQLYGLLYESQPLYVQPAGGPQELLIFNDYDELLSLATFLRKRPSPTKWTLHGAGGELKAGVLSGQPTAITKHSILWPFRSVESLLGRSLGAVLAELSSAPHFYQQNGHVQALSPSLTLAFENSIGSQHLELQRLARRMLYFFVRRIAITNTTRFAVALSTVRVVDA